MLIDAINATIDLSTSAFETAFGAVTAYATDWFDPAAALIVGNETIALYEPATTHSAVPTVSVKVAAPATLVF